MKTGNKIIEFGQLRMLWISFSRKLMIYVRIQVWIGRFKISLFERLENSWRESRQRLMRCTVCGIELGVIVSGLRMF